MKGDSCKTANSAWTYELRSRIPGARHRRWYSWRAARRPRMLYFSTGSIVTFSGPDTLSASMPESIQPNGMSPLA